MNSSMGHSGVGSAASSLPALTADLRTQFAFLIQLLAGEDNYLGYTYIIELVFTLSRLDAVLKPEERRMFVQASEFVLHRIQHDLHRLASVRQLLEQNSAFLRNAVMRCQVAEGICHYRVAPLQCEGGRSCETPLCDNQSHMRPSLSLQHSPEKRTAHADNGTSSRRATGIYRNEGADASVGNSIAVVSWPPSPIVAESDVDGRVGGTAPAAHYFSAVPFELQFRGGFRRHLQSYLASSLACMGPVNSRDLATAATSNSIPNTLTTRASQSGTQDLATTSEEQQQSHEEDYNGEGGNYLAGGLISEGSLESLFWSLLNGRLSRAQLKHLLRYFECDDDPRYTLMESADSLQSHAARTSGHAPALGGNQGSCAAVSSSSTIKETVETPDETFIFNALPTVALLLVKFILCESAGDSAESTFHDTQEVFANLSSSPQRQGLLSGSERKDQALSDEALQMPGDEASAPVVQKCSNASVTSPDDLRINTDISLPTESHGADFWDFSSPRVASAPSAEALRLLPLYCQSLRSFTVTHLKLIADIQLLPTTSSTPSGTEEEGLPIGHGSTATQPAFTEKEGDLRGASRGSTHTSPPRRPAFEHSGTFEGHVGVDHAPGSGVSFLAPRPFVDLTTAKVSACSSFVSLKQLSPRHTLPSQDAVQREREPRVMNQDGSIRPIDPVFYALACGLQEHLRRLDLVEETPLQQKGGISDAVGVSEAAPGINCDPGKDVPPPEASSRTSQRLQPLINFSFAGYSVGSVSSTSTTPVEFNPHQDCKVVGAGSHDACRSVPTSVLADLSDGDGSSTTISNGSLPRTMRSVLQGLLTHVETSITSLTSMEEQLKGEMALLIFRVVSTLVDWLIPAVCTIDRRAALFYRTWVCNLYRLMLQEDGVLDRFRSIFNCSTGNREVPSKTAKGVFQEDCSILPGPRKGSKKADPSTMEASITPETHGPTAKRSSKKDGHRRRPRQAPLRAGGNAAHERGKAVDNASKAVRTKNLLHSGEAADEAAAVHPATSVGVDEYDGIASRPISREADGTEQVWRCQLTLENSLSKVDTASPETMEWPPSWQSTKQDSMTFIIPGCGIHLSDDIVDETRQGVRRDKQSAIGERPEIDIRLSYRNSSLGVRAAVALLDEATAIPTPTSYLVTRLVAAAVRGMDKEAVPSLLAAFNQPSQRLIMPGEISTNTSFCPTPHSTDTAKDRKSEGKLNCVDTRRCLHDKPTKADGQDGADCGGCGVVVDSAIASVNSSARRPLLHAQGSVKETADGPPLVHHHRFRYPVVQCLSDVGALFRHALDDAEVMLSPHDPIRTTLVRSAVDFYASDLGDARAALELLDVYLDDVQLERVQLPAETAVPLASYGVAEITIPHRGVEVHKRAPLPSSSVFSVTSVSRLHAANVASEGARETARDSLRGISDARFVPVPVIIPSWNDEVEKEQFVATVAVLRDMQTQLRERIRAGGVTEADECVH